MQSDVYQDGVKPERAKGVVVLLHGRGASAADILTLAQEFEEPDIAYFAIQAPENSWYPFSFLAPIEQNEPFLSQSLDRLGAHLTKLYEMGFSPSQVLLLGFSQGACFALEYAARNPVRYGGLVGLSGGLIGPPGNDLLHPGSLEGTPVFLGCSDLDPYIPSERVRETGLILAQMGAQVTTRLYPQLGHTINQEELDITSKMIAGLGNHS